MDGPQGHKNAQLDNGAIIRCPTRLWQPHFPGLGLATNVSPNLIAPWLHTQEPAASQRLPHPLPRPRVLGRVDHGTGVAQTLVRCGRHDWIETADPAYELVYHVGGRSVLFVLGMVCRLARRLTQCNRKSSSEDADLSAFLDQLDDRIEEEIKRADRLLVSIHAHAQAGEKER